MLLWGLLLLPPLVILLRAIVGFPSFAVFCHWLAVLCNTLQSIFHVIYSMSILCLCKSETENCDYYLCARANGCECVSALSE